MNNWRATWTLVAVAVGIVVPMRLAEMYPVLNDYGSAVVIGLLCAVCVMWASDEPRTGETE